MGVRCALEGFKARSGGTPFRGCVRAKKTDIRVGLVRFVFRIDLRG